MESNMDNRMGDGGRGVGRGFLQPEIGHWKGQIAIREAAPLHSLAISLLLSNTQRAHDSREE